MWLGKWSKTRFRPHSCPFGLSPASTRQVAPLCAAASFVGAWGMKGADVVESCCDPDFLTDTTSIHSITTCKEGQLSPLRYERNLGVRSCGQRVSALGPEAGVCACPPQAPRFHPSASCARHCDDGAVCVCGRDRLDSHSTWRKPGALAQSWLPARSCASSTAQMNHTEAWILNLLYLLEILPNND